jgi:hypothetical protein
MRFIGCLPDVISLKNLGHAISFPAQGLDAG